MLENVEIPPATARLASSRVKSYFSASPAVGSCRCPASTDAASEDVFNGMYVIRCRAACSFMSLTVQRPGGQLEKVQPEQQEEVGSGKEGFKDGSFAVGSGASSQITAAPEADGLAPSPQCRRRLAIPICATD